MIKKHYFLLSYTLCTYFLLHADTPKTSSQEQHRTPTIINFSLSPTRVHHVHMFEKKAQSTTHYLMANIINFDQLPTYANTVSFTKPSSIPNMNKFINSYNFTGYQNARTYKNFALKHKVDLKKKRISYTLACKY